MRTVFFGPFIGEFGWELTCWQWWVRRVCLEDFKACHKIAVSKPGRAAFYPYVDEFWTLPEDFLRLGVTSWSYITAGWRNGLLGHYSVDYERISMLKRRLNSVPALKRFVPRGLRAAVKRLFITEARLKAPDMEPQAQAMLAEFKRRLPEDTMYFVPWQMNEYEGLRFGVEVATHPQGIFDFRFYPIPLSAQRVEALRPTPKGEETFRRLFPGERRLIGVFPRAIAMRRSDRNWPKAKYVQLITGLKKTYPECRVAIFGEPRGAYFVTDPPPDCFNLIDVPGELRLDVQLAALQRCLFALGTVSGGLFMATAAGCPVLCWGYADEGDRYYQTNNPLGTPMLYYPTNDPSVDEVMRVARSVFLMIRYGSWSDPRR